MIAKTTGVGVGLSCLALSAAPLWAQSVHPSQEPVQIRVAYANPNHTPQPAEEVQKQQWHPSVAMLRSEFPDARSPVVTLIPTRWNDDAIRLIPTEWDARHIMVRPLWSTTPAVHYPPTILPPALQRLPSSEPMHDIEQ